MYFENLGLGGGGEYETETEDGQVPRYSRLGIFRRGILRARVGKTVIYLNWRYLPEAEVCGSWPMRNEEWGLGVLERGTGWGYEEGF